MVVAPRKKDQAQENVVVLECKDVVDVAHVVDDELHDHCPADGEGGEQLQHSPPVVLEAEVALEHRVGDIAQENEADVGNTHHSHRCVDDVSQGRVAADKAEYEAQRIEDDSTRSYLHGTRGLLHSVSAKEHSRRGQARLPAREGRGG